MQLRKQVCKYVRFKTTGTPRFPQHVFVRSHKSLSSSARTHRHHKMPFSSKLSPTIYLSPSLLSPNLSVCSSFSLPPSPYLYLLFLSIFRTLSTFTAFSFLLSFLLLSLSLYLLLCFSLSHALSLILSLSFSLPFFLTLNPSLFIFSRCLLLSLALSLSLVTAFSLSLSFISLTSHHAGAETMNGKQVTVACVSVDRKTRIMLRRLQARGDGALGPQPLRT